MTQRHDDDTVREQAALYALGALDTKEAIAFERHLEDCAVCAAEVDSFTAVVENLGHTAVFVPVDATVKAKVLDRIAAEDAFRNAATVETDGLRFVRANNLGWAAADLPGISLKPLSADVTAGRVTQLVRMDAGATYPRHRHAGVEELFLLEGDLIVSGVLMRAGDYCRAEPESVHSGIHSPNGCVFIVSAGRDDELLPSTD